MRSNYVKNIFVVGTILLFIGVNTATAFDRYSSNDTQLSNRATTFYVGGTGPGNYTTIQAAIDNATPGDTIYVYDDSAPYHENAVINKTLTIVGENRITTIVDGDRHYCFYINADNVKITNFTLRNMTEENDGAIWINQGQNTRITRNTFLDDFHAILFDGPLHVEGTLIDNNTIDTTLFGISIWFASGITITNNQIRCEPDGELGGCGIDLDYAKDLTITHNDITAKGALTLYGNYNITIAQNNLRSDRKVLFYSAFKMFPKINIDNNYWGRPRLLPKDIPGIRFLYLFTISGSYGEHYHYEYRIYLPLLKIIRDRHPAQTPFTIPGTI